MSSLTFSRLRAEFASFTSNVKPKHTKVQSISVPSAGKSIQILLNQVLPPQCPVTGDLVERPGLLSGRGWGKLHFVEHPYCQGCSIPFALDHGEGVRCARCLADQHKFEEARAALVYNDHSHPLIVSFKHGDRTDLAPLLARLMVRAGKDLIKPESLLVPVPLHPRRLLSRRFNQSAILCQWISKLSAARTDLTSLVRIRHTSPQKDKSPDARKRNVAQAFSISAENQPKIEQNHIILVDDVLTTGSTLSACTQTLYKAGAKRVDALVLARVVKGGAQAI